MTDELKTSEADVADAAANARKALNDLVTYANERGDPRLTRLVKRYVLANTLAWERMERLLSGLGRGDK